MYYHPPFCRTVKTKFGRVFRNLVMKHFTPDHKFFKIFNKNTLKISYSCLPNIKSIINSHNRKLTMDDKDRTIEGCNCRNKQACPLEGKCLTTNLVYKAEVRLENSTKEPKLYIGSTCNSFKQRYYGHKASFDKPNLENSTQLSKYIWKLKRKKQDYQIKWTILKKSRQKRPNIKLCYICNLERMAIATAKRKNLLNSRNELVTKCPHNKRLYF